VVLDVAGLTLAEVLHKLGAGRSSVGGPINHSVGAELLVSLGQRVKKGEEEEEDEGDDHEEDDEDDLRVSSGESWLRLHYEVPAPSPDQINRLQSALTLGSRDRDAPPRALVEELLQGHDVIP